MKPNWELLRELTASLNESLASLETAQTPDEVQAINQRLVELEIQIEELLAESDDSDEFLSEIDRKRAKNEESQEIVLPAVTNPARRDSCRFDLRKFLLTYFPKACHKGLAPYQDVMVADFQRSGLGTARVATAVRRGGLKSTLARIAVAWGILYRHKRFPVLVGASEDVSKDHRKNLFDLMRHSPLILEDFPEMFVLMQSKRYPKRTLLLNGEKLECTTCSDRGWIIFPKIAGCDSSEAHVAPYSIMSTDVSGLNFTDSTGEVVRPDWLILDDVQTPQSAKSEVQTNDRENRIVTTFMGLAGLGEPMSAIMVCTVREEDCLSMRFTNRKLHPDWDGKKFPVLIHEPDGEGSKELWTTYAQKLWEGNTPEEGVALAHAFFNEHATAMNEGGIAAWELDKEPGFANALEWCMYKSIVGPDFFRCELQQQGARPKGGIEQLVASQLLKRLSGIQRGTVPKRASYLTGFVDSQDHLLIWVVCAWMTDMTGWVVEFGTWPNQKRTQWYKNDLASRLEDELPGASWEQAFVNAHNKLDELLLDREWEVEGGGTKTIDLLLKDWSDGAHMRLIEPQVLANKKYRERIRPSKGFDVKPGGKPIHKYGDSARDRHCKGCWIERRTEEPKHVQVDTNMAKDMAAKRLKTVLGAPSALLLPGDDEYDVLLLAEHCTAEKAMERSLGGVQGIVYVDIPGRDNDYWDGIVGNVVAASMLGCAVPGETAVKGPRTGKRRTLGQIMGGAA